MADSLKKITQLKQKIQDLQALQNAEQEALIKAIEANPRRDINGLRAAPLRTGPRR